jgi:CheY-like chemotaxis protein
MAETRTSLVVEYDGADDFLADYVDNLSSGRTFVLAPRPLEVGAAIRLVLTFPGLLVRAELAAAVEWVRDEGEIGVGVTLADDAEREQLAALVGRIRDRDPTVLARVIKVLVAEDNPHIAELIRAGLVGSARRSFGGELAFACAIVDNGADARGRLERELFDAMIIDVYLPVMDGAQVIAQARRELGLARLPIIAVSAGGEPARSAALAAGANVFLPKPMRLRHVLETMRDLLVA